MVCCGPDLCQRCHINCFFTRWNSCLLCLLGFSCSRRSLQRWWMYRKMQKRSVTNSWHTEVRKKERRDKKKGSNGKEDNNKKMDRGGLEPATAAPSHLGRREPAECFQLSATILCGWAGYVLPLQVLVLAPSLPFVVVLSFLFTRLSLIFNTTLFMKRGLSISKTFKHCLKLHFLGAKVFKAGPLDLSFWSVLTFLHHGIEEIKRHLLWKCHKKI